MNTVRMITAIPRELAMQLKDKKRIKDYNTLPQLHARLVAAIKEHFMETVGYDNSPIACLSKTKHRAVSLREAGADVVHYIPVRANDSVILELKMPEDCIVSAEYSRLLDCSKDLAACNGDVVAENDVIELFMDELQTGIGEDLVDAISFIPFIELEKCQFFAILDKAFSVSDFELPGIQKIDLHELNSFI